MKFFTTGSKCITMHHPPVKLPNLKWEFKRALKAQTQIQEQKQIQITNIRLKSCMNLLQCTIWNHWKWQQEKLTAFKEESEIDQRIICQKQATGEKYMEQTTMHHTDPLKGAASKAARRKGVRACTRQMTPIQCCLHSLGQFCKCNFEQQVYMYKSMTEWPFKKCAWVFWMLLENMYKIGSSLMQHRNDIIWCLNSQAGCLTNNQQCPLFPSVQFFC